MKILVKSGLLFRRVYTKIKEFFMINFIYRLSKEVSQQLRVILNDFQSRINTLNDYSRELAGLRVQFPWISDPLRGLIDWTLSRRNLHKFFWTDPRVSRDCDDFSTLAFYTLRERIKNIRVREWCVFIDKRLSRSHMIVTAHQPNGNWFIFDNHSTFIIPHNISIKEEFQRRYKCGNWYAKYR